jgi:hypothetical protein
MARIANVSVDLMASFAGGDPINVGVLEVPLTAELGAATDTRALSKASVTVGADSFKTSLAQSFRAAADELDGLNAP